MDNRYVSICYCEDEKAQADWVRAQIEEWARKQKVRCNLELYESAEEFLFKNDVFSYDLMLLDISMNQMNGLELAKRIRQVDSDVKLVFLTSDQSFVFQGYEVNAFRYLMKPIEPKQLWELLDLVMETIGDREKAYILRKISNENVRIPVQEILYVEAQGHYLDIHRKNGETIHLKESFQKLKEELSQLSPHLVSCHRSFLVNLEYVELISKTQLTLMDQQQIPVSRSAYGILNQQFIQFNLKGRL